MPSGPPVQQPIGRISIIIPAHNEEASIGRLLKLLLAEAAPGEFDLVVACNGCTDRTAEVASGFGSDVRVLEIAEASKRLALQAANDQARTAARIYVDADVELSTHGARALREALEGDGILAAGPERSISFNGVSWLVRSYYRVWLQLPQVRSGLFGRGVIAVSAVGYERIASLPPMMSDDLAVSEAFAADERIIVADASVRIWPPRTLRDLLRRRVRVNTGNAQLDEADGRSASAKTSWADLIHIARTHPGEAPGIAVFVAIALVSKVAARRRVKAGDYTTWLRDESSRETSP